MLKLLRKNVWLHETAMQTYYYKIKSEKNFEFDQDFQFYSDHTLHTKIMAESCGAIHLNMLNV